MSSSHPRSANISPFSARQLAAFRQAYAKKRFAGQVIGVTGHDPESHAAVKRAIADRGGIVGDKEIWQPEQIIVIGRKDWSEEYLKLSIVIGKRFDFTCAYLSQEAFQDLIDNDRYPGYYKGDPRIEAHPGLSFLSSIGFKWPSIEATPGSGSSDPATGWQLVHPLKSIYGYNVQAGTRENVRHDSLSRAIRADALGLYEVACHIAFLIQNAKRRHDNVMEDAIDNWESDLEWLRKTYYENSFYSFVWPS